MICQCLNLIILHMRYVVNTGICPKIRPSGEGRNVLISIGDERRAGKRSGADMAGNA